jgi:prepilin-type N-terminal cleavage/methylation domain-containing protein/prepilin-type processing-associated H-X9-DG protein
MTSFTPAALETRVSKRSAFTLIELLVVIGIVSLLAAAIFPVYVNAREKGRQSTCMTNMKQITMQFIQYQDEAGTSEDSTWKAPWEKNPYPPPPPSDKPYDLGFPMRKGDRWEHITECPSDARFDRNLHRFSYMLNAFADGLVLPRGQVRNPSSTIYLVEASHDPVVALIQPWRIYDAGTHALNTTELAKLKSEIAVDRHHGGSNYAFMDGHVKWMHFEQTVQPVSLYDIRNK